jgi:hypothetical protein
LLVADLGEDPIHPKGAAILMRWGSTSLKWMIRLWMRLLLLLLEGAA